MAPVDIHPTVNYFQLVPQPVQWGLAGVGALVVISKLWSYLLLVLDCFVLSGNSVSCPLFALSSVFRVLLSLSYFLPPGFPSQTGP